MPVRVVHPIVSSFFLLKDCLIKLFPPPPILTGIKISHAKMRTFGVHWGVNKANNPPLRVHTKGWDYEEVEMKTDGTMKSLGVKFDMHVDNQVQLMECENKIKETGEQVFRVEARKRDRMLALGYCLLTNIVYRTQHCPWHLHEFEKLDKSYLALVRKAARLIPGFPSRLITIDRKDGGLGVTSTVVAAMERKRKMMLILANSKGAASTAMLSQISRMLREAGQGGLGPVKWRLWPALGDLATGLSALIEWLKHIKLRVRIGWGEMEGWELACPMEQDIEARSDMNKRGIVLASELSEGGDAPIRVGQCWEIQGKVCEILGFRDEDIEIMEWTYDRELSLGKTLVVTDDDVLDEPNSDGRPTGMGGRNTINRAELIEKASHILELSRDKITRGGEGRLKCQLMARREKKARERQVNMPYYLREDWAKWRGGDFSYIYTDGSYKEESNWGDYLLGRRRSLQGGGDHLEWCGLVPQDLCEHRHECRRRKSS